VRSSNPWQRRASVACGASLNQRGRSLTQITLALCAPLLNDPDLLVRKAVAWALREASEKDEPGAFELLRKNKLRAHPTVLREGSKKLSRAHRAALLGE
jgi:3-methyladenine DNA glycosylase AlkD